MEEKISLEFAKQNEKSYKNKRMLLYASMTLIGLIIIGIFITGCVFTNSNIGLSLILLFGAIILGFLYGYFFFYKGIFFKEGKIIQQFLSQERKIFVEKNKSQLAFNLNDKSQQSELFEKYVNLYLENNAVYYDTSMSLEEQIKFEDLLNKIQDYLKNVEKKLNEQAYCNNLAQRVKDYVTEIKDDYNVSEYKIICDRLDEWIKFHNKYSETFESALEYITHYEHKKIASKAQIEQFSREKFTINPTNYDKYWDLAQAIRKHNQILEKYTFEDAWSYYISDSEKSDFLDEYYKMQDRGNKDSKNARYINYCWNCKYPINEDIHTSKRKCSKCGGYHCSHCGACLCGLDTKK